MMDPSTNAEAAPRPKAYSYLRFSTPEQRKGDSFRRQWEIAKAYTDRHGLDLDENLTFHDIGVSAFKGANAERGRLAAFRRAVEDGTVAPGSYLLVEDFDRLSRMDPWDAMGIFREIIEHGVTVVTLKDERVWHRAGLKANPMQIMESILAMWTGHQESLKKGFRLQETYKAKRQRLLDGKPPINPTVPYKHGPAWLTWVPDERRFVLNSQRAAVVREIFAKADEGWSIDRIARHLNERSEPTWGGRGRKADFWRGSYVRKIITNRAAIGTLVMHRTEQDERSGARRDKIEGSIEGYFPQVIDREVFDRVTGRMSTTAPRGRNASLPTKSVVAGLAKCAYCGRTVLRVSKGEYVYLVCSMAHAKAGCRYKTVPYATVEDALRDNAGVLLEEAPRGGDTEKIEGHIASLEVRIDQLADEARDLSSEYRTSRSPGIREQLYRAERELDDARKALTRAKEQRDRTGAPFVLRRLETLRKSLGQDPFDVVAANQALRACVSEIILDPEAGKVWLHWADTERVSYVNFVSKHGPFGKALTPKEAPKDKRRRGRVRQLKN